MNKLVVSIVGRPNVGKSTLFNRIIRRREAIVDDTPGVTRDRKCTDAQWEGKDFTLVDTGGYISRSSDIIEIGVTSQVRIAIEEADLIIFLVDVTTGITSEDDEVARILRKSGKLCVLTVNKADNNQLEFEAAEFIRLGLGEPVGISALIGRGVGDLLSLVIHKLPPDVENITSEDEDVVKLAVVGKPNVGKSTFINKILGEERLLVTEIPGTTRDSVDINIQYDDHRFLLIDTAGMRRRSRIQESVEYYSTLRAHRVVERCDVASVFINADEGVTLQDLRVLREVIDAKKGVLLVGNKWDLIKNDPEKKQELTRSIDSRMQGFGFVPVIFASCKTGLRLEKIMDMTWLIAMERRKRISSSVLNQLIEDMGRQYQPPAVRGKRIRILYATQAGTNPPRFVLFSNYPLLIKESYKRFIENQIRENFGFEGVPITLIFKKK